MRSVLVAALTGLIATPFVPAAHADVVPTLNGGRLEILTTAPGDRAVIARSGDALVLTGNGIARNVASVAAVSEIAFVDASGGATEAAIDLGGGRLGGIVVRVDLGTDTDTMRILGETGYDRIYVGPAGVNLTGDTDHVLDVPAPAGIDRWVIEGRGGHDLLSAGGDAKEPVGGPLTVPIEIIAGPGGGLFKGGNADDLIRGGSGNDQLYGGDGHDFVTTGGGSDQVSGGVGDDVLDNGPGPDSIQGDTGRDQLVHQTIGGPVEIDLGRSDFQAAGATGSDKIGGIETVVGTPFADRLAGNQGSNRLLGAGGDDALFGAAGDDLLDGGDGDDVLSGDTGQDVVDGGPGRDTAAYGSSPGGVSVTLGPGGAGTSSAASGTDTLASIEDVAGSPHNDHLAGNAGPNRLLGGGGRDRLVGELGSDWLDGGEDDDTVKSADGVHDVVECGMGKDLVDADRLDTRQGCEVRGSETARMELLALTYQRRAHRLRMRLRCPATARFACRGKVRVTLRVRSRGRVRSIRAARWSQFEAILAGQTRTVTRSLRPAARRPLRRDRPQTKVVLRVAAQDEGKRNVGLTLTRGAKRLRAAASR